LTGLVVVDKEAGWTSHDVVARVRKALGTKRVGHAGTLDPDATGVLLVGVGRTTRLLRFLTPLPKTYVADVVLGEATTTLDASGDVVGSWDMSSVTLDDVRAAAASFVGEILQTPPMVSAVKVGGQRLHALARRGIEVERRARPVTIHRLSLDPGPRSGVFSMEVTCSSGTYVRVLAADLGVALGGGAHVENLRRVEVGQFTVDDACPVSAVGPGSVRVPLDALRHLAPVEVKPEIVDLIARGLPLDRVPLGATGDGPWALVDGSARLLAVYEATGTDRIRPSVVLAAR
jgi:tRNA pseudouridine55 synthase